MLNIIKI